jgi:hypothetical protein
MAYSIIWSRCPYCRRILDIRSQHGIPSPSKLGEVVIKKCEYCGQLISNGKKEWPDMTSGEKGLEIIFFIFNSLLCGMIVGGLGSFFILGLLFGLIENNLKILLILSSICWFLFSLLFANHYKLKINESIARYKKMQII